MTDLLTAVGLMLVIEGAIYSLFPGGVKRMAAQITETPGDTVRIFGVVSATLGVILVWLLRG